MECANTVRVDLHTHTTASDGELAPQELFAMQAAAGVELLAITDHDTVAGWAKLYSGNPLPSGPLLIPGIEFSASDGRQEVHIVGLRFDPTNRAIGDAITAQAMLRRERAQRIGERFRSLGIEAIFERATEIAGEAAPGRTHFARALVESGRVRDAESAFKRYLGSGKPASVPHQWPAMEQVVSWIRAGGGRAVLAHPAAYALTRTQLQALVQRFAQCGGEAIEVAMPNVEGKQLRMIVELARRYRLLASSGSDFHAPAQRWRLPSQVPALPSDLRPVWHDWS